MFVTLATRASDWHNRNTMPIINIFSLTRCLCISTWQIWNNRQNNFHSKLMHIANGFVDLVRSESDNHDDCTVASSRQMGKIQWFSISIRFNLQWVSVRVCVMCMVSGVVYSAHSHSEQSANRIKKSNNWRRGTNYSIEYCCNRIHGIQL